MATRLVSSAADRQDPQALFRSGVRTVPVHATVRDREGRLAPDLGKEDFQILDNGTPVEISTFSNEVLPFTAVLLLDMSHSMLPSFRRVRASALRFVQALLPADRVRIGTFGREVSISPLLTSDKAVLTRILEEELWPGGATPLWRASTAAMDSLAGESGRRVLLFLTDGNDSGGDYNCAPLVFDARGAIGRPCPGRGSVRRQAEDAGFMFYAIGLEGGTIDGGLIDIVEETGGGHFLLKRNADLDTTFERVADELHHQYAIGFNPVVFDGKTHKLDVRVTRTGLTVRSRKSYVAGIDK